MNQPLHKSLDTLLELRGQELEKCQAELAAKQSLCARMAINIERLGQLMADVGTGAAVSAGQALNTAAYKQSLQELVDTQRGDLTEREAEAGEAQAAVNAAACRQEVLDQLLKQSRAKARQAETRQAQKRQDELAAQVWMRKQA